MYLSLVVLLITTHRFFYYLTMYDTTGFHAFIREPAYFDT
jgi:hypothetical protein